MNQVRQVLKLNKKRVKKAGAFRDKHKTQSRLGAFMKDS